MGGMRRLLALLAVAALILAACGSEEGTDTESPSSTPDSGPAMDAEKTATDAAKDAPKSDIVYECGCGKTHSQAADLPPPS